MSRLDEITARKQRLIGDSDQARNEIARVYYRYQARTVIARQVTAFFKNPLVLAGLGLFALKMPWRKAYRLGGWGWRVWRLLRTIRRFVV
jgi:hypothetical protein